MAAAIFSISNVGEGTCTVYNCGAPELLFKRRGFEGSSYKILFHDFISSTYILHTMRSMLCPCLSVLLIHTSTNPIGHAVQVSGLTVAQLFATIYGQCWAVYINSTVVHVATCMYMASTSAFWSIITVGQLVDVKAL